MSQGRRSIKICRKASGNRPAAREDGAALIMVLTVIFVLSTLGGIALMTTLGNVRMSDKYTEWTAEYYALDSEAEERLQKVDAALSLAEAYVAAYLRDECYRMSDDLPAVTGNDETELNEKGQNAIYNFWFSEVYQPCAVTDESGMETINQQMYDIRFRRFHDDYYKRLFYYYSYRLMQAEIDRETIDRVEVTASMRGYAGMLSDYTEDAGGMGMMVYFDITDGAEAFQKHVSVALRVVAPKFGLTSSTEAVPFKGNPIWTNALSAKGNIVFSGNDSHVRVYGDVFAQSYADYFPRLNEYAVVEGNNNGILSAGATVEIRGNVYTRGDLHVTESGGSIAVGRYSEETATEYKRNVHTNSLFFDTSTMPAMIQRYTQAEDNSWSRDFIPFFYRDHLGGNVYCNSLAIEAAVHNGTILIDNGLTQQSDGAGVSGEKAGLTGVVWTFDDVQNDGEYSKIDIRGNLIGLSSEALFNDHTTSSTVINANYRTSSINLAGDIIMPGTSFRRFDGLNDMADEAAYFETAESVSADNFDIFKAYTEPPVNIPEVPYFFDRYILSTEKGLANVFLINYIVLGDKVRHLAGNLSASVPDTGITTKSDLFGYARGAVISKDTAGNKQMFGMSGVEGVDHYREIGNYAQNLLAYSEIRDSLKAAYYSKTEKFGTPNGTFDMMVNKGAMSGVERLDNEKLSRVFTYLTGDSSLEITGNMKGIIYCASENGELPTLTLYGNGRFSGTVICEGNIVLNGALRLYYDERMLSDLLITHPEIKAFFAPGETGDTSYIKVLKVAQSSSKISRNRFEIADWSEWQE